MYAKLMLPYGWYLDKSTLGTFDITDSMNGGEYMAVVLPEAGYGMAEVAELTGFHGKYVYELARKGELRTYRGIDGKLKVSRMALELFLREREK